MPAFLKKVSLPDHLGHHDIAMHLLLIEDDPLLADGIANTLSHAGHSVQQAFNGHQADVCLQAADYDVAILDLGLPGIDGSDVLRRLRNRGNKTPVLVVSARDALDERVRLLDIGADDYLVKPVAMAELEARIRALGRRRTSEGTPQINVGQLRLDLVSQRAEANGTPIELTAREWSILSLLAAHAKRVVSKEEIVQALYQSGSDGSPNAVEVFVSRLRAKLESSGVAIRTVRGLGYYLDDQ